MAENNASFLESLFDPTISEAYRLPAIDGLPADTKPAPEAQPQPQPQSQPNQAAVQPAAARGLAPTRADVIRRAQELDIDPALALSFFRAESSGNFNIRDSNKGAIGGFQVMPGTYKQMMGTAEGMRDPWNNMEAGLRYMAYGQKVLGTRDPALLAAGYHAGYGRSELKRGEIPDTHDGLMSTRDYARKVARGAGGVDAAELRNASGRATSSDEAGRFVPLGADEIKRLGLEPGDADEGRYVPLSADEVAAFETSVTPKQNEPGIAGDMARQLSGGLYKGVGYLARGAGKIPQIVGEYTTTPLINKVFGTNYRTGNVLDSTADALAGVGDKIQQGVSSETKNAIQQSTPDGNLFEPSTWTFGAKPSLRGYLALGTDVLGGMLPVIAATVATSGASSVVRIGAGASVGGAQGGGGAVDDARQAIDKMAKDGTLEQESAYYRELLAQGKSPAEALQTTRDAAEKVAFLLTTPVSAAGGAATAKLLHPAEKLFVGRNVAARAAGRGVLSGLEEGTQEAGEKIQTNQGINVGAGTNIDPMQGTFGDFVLGAVAGTAPGTVAGGFSKRESRAPAPKAAPAPAAEAEASGPLTRAVEKVADDQTPPRATVSNAEGQVSGTVQAYQEDGQGGFQAQILGDDGQVYTFSDKDGVQLSIEQPEAQAGPLTGALEKAAEGAAATADAADTAAPAVDPAATTAAVPDAAAEQAPTTPTLSEQAVAQVAPPVERAKAEADLSAMSEAQLRARLKFIANQAKNNGGMNKMLVAERKRVEKEINARVEAAKTAEPAAEKAAPVAEPAKTSFDTIQDANAAMLAAADRTGQVHEVVEQDGKFIVRPIQEAANGSDERGRSAGPDVRAEPADGKRADADGHPAGERPAAAAEPRPQADAAAVPASQPADQQPALSKDLAGAKPKTASKEDLEHLFGVDKKREAALKRIAKGTAFFGTAAKAKDYIAKNGLKDTHTVEQTGKVRFEVKAKEAAVDHAAAKQESDTAPAPAASASEAVKQIELLRRVVRTYKTKGGKVGAEVKENIGRDGGVTYSYSGEWGAGSGIQEADMRKTESLWQSQKRGFTLEQAGNSQPHEAANAKAADAAAADAPAVSRDNTAPAADERVAGDVAQDAAKGEVAGPKAAAAPNALFSGNKIFTAYAVEKARARLKSKLSQVNSGIDPEIMMDGLVISGAYIEAGVRRFSDYAKAMVDDLGEAITPYLLSFYEAARNYPGIDTDGMSTPATARKQHEAMLAELAESAKPATMNQQEAQDDAQPTETDAGKRAEEPASEPVRADEGGRDAGGDTQRPGGDGRAVDQRRAADGDRGGDQRGPAGLRGRSAAAPADAEQPVQGSRERGDQPGGRADRSDGRPASSVSDYRIAPGELARAGSWRATAARNIEIVELVKAISAAGRQATQEEKAQLAKFTGWGASEIANGIFPDRYGRYKNADWQALGERLKAALSEDEYAQARRTTQYAHYTSEAVIRSIYAGLDRLGFKGGTLLEPGMGVGHFNGLMPDNIAANSRYTGVEYDAITGAIAKLLYPASNVIVGDFTRTNLPKDFFDAAIGNPPFSQTQVLNDPEYKALRPMLHDYFFMKTIDRVKPGAPLVFVTSKGTMDKVSDKSRKYLAERANLLGAIRLPQTAFKDNAGTEVVTDVIFLQKKGDGIPDNGVAWLGTKEVTTPQGPTAINEYFADHPEMVLGTHALQGSMYRANEYTVLPLEGDIEQHFAKAVERLPESVLRPARGSLAERALVADRDFNPKHKKEGGLYLADDGKLMQVEDGSGVAVEFRAGADGKRIALTPKQKKWLRGYVGVRDALKQAQYDQLNDGAWEQSLQALNQAYDAFVKEHGPILDYTVIERADRDTGETTETKRFRNEPLLRLDVEGALAYALENVKEDGSIVKGAALNGRVLERAREPEIKTTNDAMFVSLNRNGVLDLDDVARLAGSDRASVIRDLGTAIYEAPDAGWQLADEYLSGNVVRKLKEAQAAAEVDPKYRRNVEALLAVQPRPLGPSEITVRLGANWVPPTDISNFASDVLGERISVAYSPITGNWTIEQHSFNGSEFSFNKMSAGDILSGVLNARQLKVTFRDQDGKTHVDLEATEKANDIAGKMRERFRTWIWTDPARADRLLKHYNEHFNNIAPRQFDGSHLTLPGVSSRFKLYPHQKRAVWRVIQQGDVYLAHAVGAGKTMEMIAAGMEERRLGLVKKPMYVVPNHMLAQFSREFLELYPAANIMVADEHNFHTHNRKRFVAQAALNNPDAIVITHAAFGRIAMSDDYANAFIQRQIDEWKSALDDVDKGDRVTVKQIERRIEQLERRLEGKQGKDKKDRVLDFEELGVDKLYVDEFHEFRKLDFPTNQGNVKGIDPNGSQRALDLYMKTEYLRGKKPGRALVAASGTPVTNTMGELFTVQRFFQPEQMKEDGLDSFDAWSAQYGDIVTGFEQNAAGGYDMVARFAKFQNVPELMRRVRSFMDILTGSSLGALVQRPDVAGGGRQVVVTPVPDGYKEYQQQLQRRIQAIRNRKGPPKKGDDIILAVIGDGRFSAIDMRFVDPSLPADPNSKLNQWIDAIIAAYRETADNTYATGGQVDPLTGSSIVGFTDIGLGEQSAAGRGFDMKAWIEQRLVDAGIPAAHVAFMRDHKQHAKKERLFADMREGKKRILIGGKKMETGTNVQKRLTHLFHLDAPWFPASVEQREGRIVRQGNQNQEVTIKAYATKGSYDSTMWGMNARKARFIEQAMNGDDSVRSLDDVSEASAFEMASALASGDERYLKLAGLKTEVERLERLRHAHFGDQNSARREKHWYEEAVKRNSARAKELQAAIERRTPIRAGEFLAHVGKQPFASREEFSAALFDAFKREAAANFSGDKVLGTIGGFDITFFGEPLKHGEYVAELYVQVPGADPILAYPIDPQMAVAGIATRAANQVNSLDRRLAEVRAEIETSTRKAEQFGKRLGAAFPEEAILLDKLAELSALQAELAAEGEPSSADAAAATTEAEQAAPDAGARFSVAAEPDDVTMLQRIAAAAELFQLPTSDKDTVEGIAADNDPRIQVKKLTDIPGETRYTLKLPDGNTARMVVRPYSDYGPALYGYDMVDGEMQAITAGRPGKNGQAMDGKDDVWIDVSLLSPGSGYGAMIYNIAATYAHNTGKVFIGDPAGLSDEALQRRPEMMLSSALKFGTTEHLAPHPRQVTGDEQVGVPPLAWVYGDHAGNIDKLAKVNLANIENAGGIGGIRYNKDTNTFEDSDGNPLTRADIDDLGAVGLGRAAQAGGRTLARHALIQSLIQGEGGSGRDAGRPNALLGAFFQLLRDHDPADLGSPLRRILYSSRPVPDSEGAAIASQAEGAIVRLMHDKAGEAAVSHPTLGAIAIPYGDKNAGLQHIARRHGHDFLQRIPALLASGQVYTKPGQNGRVFIGNERDEAAIRLDWNGQDKAWLLSAYEKHPDLQPAPRSQAPQRAADTGLRAAGLQGAISKGVLGPLVRAMVDSGVVVLHDTTKTLPKGLGRGVRGVQAVTEADGTVHLVAGALREDNARAVMLHELFHRGGERVIGSEQWGQLMGRMGSLYRQGEQSSGRAREFFDKARARVAAAKRQGAVATRMEVEEFAAYAIEEYESAPAAVRKWVDDFLGFIKAWLVKRFGKQLGEVTPAQLAALAKMALMDVAADHRGQMFGPIGELFSVSNMDAATADPSLLDGAAAASPADQVPRNPVSDPEAGFTPPEQGMLRRLQSAVQDNMNRLKQVQRRISTLTGIQDLGKADYYLAETNWPGRVAARLEDMEKKLTGPLMAKLAQSGHTPAQLEELLHAMHAEERNARVALINPQHDPDSDEYSGVQGSGMNDDEAQAILAKYAGNRELHALAQQARDIARATLDLKHAYGLLDDAAYEALTKAYEYYVPLKGDGEFGPKVKRAMGHGEREEHILQNLARDYEQAVVVGEKNLARQSLLRLVLEFPDEALWTARVPPRGRYVAGQVYNIVHRGETVGSFVSRAQVDAFLEAKGDKAAQYEVLGSNGDRVQEFVKPLQDHEVMVYVNGEPIRLQFKDAKLAAQLRPLDQGKMHPILEFMRGMNRYLSKIYTGYNPAFILRNAARDAMTGSVNMLGNEGALVAASAWRRYPQALAALGRWAASGKTPDSKTGHYLNEYRMHGGKVGASWLSDLEEQGKTLNRMYEDAYGAAGYLRSGQNLKAAKVAGRKIVGGMAHTIEIANQATENALRLALFIALRERGATPGKAAQAAKQVTVDFDRKGSAGGALGAIYLFFNPAVQGASNALRTLAHGKHKGQAFAALGGLALLGLYAAAQGMDDDRDRWLGQGWDTRTRNFILHVGDKQIRVPLSQEFAPVYALGVAFAEAGRGERASTVAVRLVASFLDALFPLQGAFKEDSDNHALDAVLAATPTLLQPFAQSASNRNAFGSQIVPESEFTKARPDNLKMFRGTKNSAYDQAAQGIAALGEMLGAGKYENDLSKISPETLKLMWRTYTGGLGQFVTDSIGVASMAAADAGQVEASDVPILKDFYRSADVKPIRSRYYDLAREAKAAATEFAQAKKAGDGEAMDKILSGPKGDIIGLGRLVSSTSKAAAALRDLEVDINADQSLTPAEKRAQLKALEKEEEALYRSAIGAFK